MTRPAWMLPEVGSLYRLSSDDPFGFLPSPWSQPGGVGTQVFPQMADSAAGQFETPMVPTGMYVPGCGHPCNCLRIFKQYDIITQEHWALICCPACGYIQAIEPYRDYQNYIETPIVVA